MDNVKNIFVSVNGDDLASGTKENPLKTIKAAQMKCREFLKENNSVTIYIREGDYAENLILSDEDSGKNGGLVSYEAYQDEKVRLLGGVKLDNISKITDEAVARRLCPEIREKVYEIKIPEETIGQIDEFVSFMTCAPELDEAEVRVVKNGEILCYAGYPEVGEYLTIDDVISQDYYTNGDRVTDFTKTKPAKVKITCDRIKNWEEPEKIWVYGYPAFDWACYFGKAHEINGEEETFELHQPLPFAVRENQRVRFVNILEELDHPNEFYIDKQAGKIYVISENPETDTFEIALSGDHLLKISGAENITFKNITFSLCRKDAAVVENSKNVNIIGCEFSGNMKGALFMNKCYDCEIKDNHIFNMGGRGINVNCGEPGQLKASGVKVLNNEIHDFAKIVEMYQHAIKIDGYGNYAAHNEIYNTTQSAIQFSGNCNVFEYNEVYDCLKKTADSGAVGCGRTWTSSRNIFRYNYFHDLPISTCGHTTKGIYLDDIMLGTEIYSNIFENVQSGVYSHGGRKATIKNNIFIGCKTYSVRIFTCGHVPCPGFVDVIKERTKKYMDENPKWAAEFTETRETVEDTLCMFPLYNKVNGNIFIDSPEPSIEFGAGYAIEMENNLVTDDKNIFVDFDNRNFAIKDIDELKKIIPDFDAPEFEKIGRIK